MSKKSFAEVGLPVGHAFPELAYHHATRSIIVQTRPTDGISPYKRLFIRKVTEPTYAPIGEFDENGSAENPCLCQAQPLLYFATFSWTKRETQASPTYAGDWDALHRYRLDTRQCEVVGRRGDLFTEGEHQRIWLTKLLSVSDDGQSLFVVAGIESPLGSVGYFVCDLNLSDKRLKTISELEAAFA